jgi:hypothetical protein
MYQKKETQDLFLTLKKKKIIFKTSFLMNLIIFWENKNEILKGVFDFNKKQFDFVKNNSYFFFLPNEHKKK